MVNSEHLTHIYIGVSIMRIKIGMMIDNDSHPNMVYIEIKNKNKQITNITPIAISPCISGFTKFLFKIV
mgnify:CR=1 FL=1